MRQIVLVLFSLIFLFSLFGSGLSLANSSNDEAADKPALSPTDILVKLDFPSDQSVEFVQRQRNPLMLRESEQQGTLRKTAEGLFMDVTEPRAEHRHIHQGFVTLERQHSSRRRAQTNQDTYTRRAQLEADNPAHIPLLALEALLTGQHDFLAENFTQEIVVSEDHWQLSLYPTLAKLDNARLILRGCSQTLSSFRFERGDVDNPRQYMEVIIPSANCPLMPPSS